MKWLGIAARWLHPRWGQMLCFWVGGLELFPSVSDPIVAERNNLVVGGGLVAIGLTLKALAILKAATATGALRIEVTARR